ncbi:tol-pal system protein YbgF [Variovorax boronicumulans]|jgi:tol-pal system protein YbgF|uniref:Cell division coordinator CpoB n=1 Tax=Variovorax boronicumulans TaxID=436515 RepID=A0AAW8CTB7_9BURK|nr:MULTISPECIES: tol-pal system protein YbgF [Variovorax]MCR6476197.1 tol-pal system protein YbgF [Variovorax sp. ZS18.2.2]MDP9891091.1 tol-pal system protein YbgF [Variovorax boronicumulans]MDP9995501.1 tol-pal system protein YbgF [Variovorax boronicumulans]MDQ0007256.1 tol-pal system protein YbgF [Variovorax boronicumulans]MDQ0035471.1 tol-pal system protein YbgF [Variovorax boronicumulans]
MPRALLRGAALAAALLCVSMGSQAALFEDDEARKAILDLRQRVEAMRQQTDQRLTDENGQLRRSLLDLQNQIEQMRGDLARMTGQNEQLTRTLSEMQSRQTTIDDKLKQNEPSKVTVDGREFNADPKEKADFEAALGIFRAGQFAQSQTAFAEFVKRYPQSGYNASALFWLGNAQYATRNYNEAIANFRSMLSLAPDHAKAPEAVLSIANCQIELKDTRSARRTLEDLAKAYPQSEAAQAGRERLSRLR